jgi:CYTH domain-containing protein
MNKTAEILLYRLFLINALPEPLSTRSRHLQILDRYLPGTKLRLREIRDPYSNERTRLLQKRTYSPESPEIRSSEIQLDVTEYSLFERHSRSELRKNRYFHEYDQMLFAFDVHLGPLLGLNLAKVSFETREEFERAGVPAFASKELTSDWFFLGENLCQRDYSDVARHLEAAKGR